MNINRRTAMGASAGLLAGGMLGGMPGAGAPMAEAALVGRSPRRGNPIATSSYSFWRFNEKTRMSMEDCLDRTAEMGFDGFEVLYIQMGEDLSNARLQRLKRRALVHGVALCGCSTHQSFVKPDQAERQQNVELTKRHIDFAHELGIPTIRVNTGRWGTTRSFDALMANKGMEPNLPGFTDDEGFDWVISSFEQLVPYAEKKGVVMGLENHWGLGRTADGVLRVINAVNSPWLQATLDTGNFLENQYQQAEQLAPRPCLCRPRPMTGAASGTRWTSTTRGSRKYSATSIIEATSRSNSKARRTSRPRSPRAWNCSASTSAFDRSRLNE